MGPLASEVLLELRQGLFSLLLSRESARRADRRYHQRPASGVFIGLGRPQ